MEVADNFALSTFNIIQDLFFFTIMRSNVEVLNNQSHMADMKQRFISTGADCNIHKMRVSTQQTHQSPNQNCFISLKYTTGSKTWQLLQGVVRSILQKEKFDLNTLTWQCHNNPWKGQSVPPSLLVFTKLELSKSQHKAKAERTDSRIRVMVLPMWRSVNEPSLTLHQVKKWG